VSANSFTQIATFYAVDLDGPDKGIIPLTCNELFERLATKTAADSHLSFTVEVSYIEVRCTRL